MELMIIVFLLFAGSIIWSIINGVVLLRNSRGITPQYSTTAKLLSWNLIEPGVTCLYILGLFLFGSRIPELAFSAVDTRNLLAILILLAPMVILLMPGLVYLFGSTKSPYLKSAFYIGVARIIITILTYFFIAPILFGVPLLMFSIVWVQRRHASLLMAHTNALSVGAEGMMIVPQSSLNDSVKINL